MRRKLFVALIGSALLAAATSACGDDEPAGGDDEKDLGRLALLGKRLFEDERLSEPAGQSCASCHAADIAFQGDADSPNPAVAQGSRPGILGGRNVPMAMYAAFVPRFHFEDDEGELIPVGGLFWDGRADDLAAQARGPFLNPREMNNPDRAAVIAKIRSAPYADLALELWGENGLDDTDAAFFRMSEAIAEFERSARFAPFRSRFDDHLRGTATLSAAEERGFALFKDPEKGNCLACHVGDEASSDPRDWLFTDNTYDNLGVPRNRTLGDNDDPAHFDLGLCGREGFSALVPAGVDPDSFCGAFRVPSLRNVAVTPPYFHNGQLTTLEEVVRFYVTRDVTPALWYPGQPYDDLPPEQAGNVNTAEVPYDRGPGQSPRLDEAEIADLVAFLQTLTDR